MVLVLQNAPSVLLGASAWATSMICRPVGLGRSRRPLELRHQTRVRNANPANFRRLLAVQMQAYAPHARRASIPWPDQQAALTAELTVVCTALLDRGRQKGKSVPLGGSARGAQTTNKSAELTLAGTALSDGRRPLGCHARRGISAQVAALTRQRKRPSHQQTQSILSHSP